MCYNWLVVFPNFCKKTPFMKLRIQEREEGRQWVQIALWRLPSERLSVPKEKKKKMG